MAERTVIIGVGNRERGDDAAGPEVAERIVGPLPGDVDVVVSGGDPADLLDAMEGHDRVILVDALAPEGHPGRVVRLTDPGAFASVRPASSHVIGPAEVLGLAAALDRLPAEVVVYGVEGAGFEPGGPLTDEVAIGVEVATGMILEELADA